MTTSRIVIETPCDCAEAYGREHRNLCNSPHRRTLTEGQYVLIERICSECGGTFGTCFNAKLKCCPDCAHFPSTLATSAAHALSDHTEGTP